MSNVPEITVNTSSACAVKPGNLPRAKAVKVNGVAIGRDAISRETQNHPAKKPVEAWKSATRALVVRELLLQEARRQNLPITPISDAEGRRETDEEAAIRGLVDAAVKIPEPNATECRRVYEANTSRFRSPNIVEARHILIAASPDDGSARAAAKSLAFRLIDEIAREPSLFAELAALHSKCPSAETGGNLGQISDGQTVPEFERALDRAPVGEVAPMPVETRYGFHVVFVDRRIPGAQMPFEVAQPQIAAWLTERSRHIGIRAFVSDLVRSANIEGLQFDLTEA